MTTLIRRIPSLSRASINDTALLFGADGYTDLAVMRSAVEVLTLDPIRRVLNAVDVLMPKDDK